MRTPVKLTRDTVLFTVGLLGIAFETLVTGGERPTLLILFGGMVGLPVFLRTDEKAHVPPPPTVPPPVVPEKAGE